MTSGLPAEAVQRGSHARAEQRRRLEPQSRRELDAVDIRNENMTEAEARKRLSSLVVVCMERSTNPYDIDEGGNPVLPTWEKAKHTVQRDISQEEARRKVRQLDRETSSVADKKHELSSPIRRQLDHAWDTLENMESDPRFVYTLAQLDWKLKRVDPDQSHDRKHDRRSKDKKRGKERQRSKRSPSRSKSKRERASVTAYFKREPARKENCVRMLRAQQMERREYESRSLPLNERQPMVIPGQPPRSRSVHFHPTSPPRIRTHQPLFRPQVQCSFPLNQPTNGTATHPRGSSPPPPPPFPPPPPSSSQPPLSALPARVPPPFCQTNSSRSNISKAIEAQNRRIQSNAPSLERQDTTRSHNSRSSIASFSSLSSEDSDDILTPNSSFDASSPQDDRQRGRSRYRERRHGGESVALEVARRHRPHNPADRFIGIPPPAPDPIKAVPDADVLRHIEQRMYSEGIRDAHVTPRSLATGNVHAARQPQIIQDPLGTRRAPQYHTSRYTLGGQNMDRLGERISRTSLSDEPRRRPEPERDPTARYEYREPPRRYRDDSDDEILMPGSSRGPWRRQDAQRYMANRRRTDQDAWDLGSSGPLRYGDNQRRETAFAGFER
ncbi:hypothetical protein V8C35DRAFT_313840 [Trichoderma chlorosporum]